MNDLINALRFYAEPSNYINALWDDGSADGCTTPNAIPAVNEEGVWVCDCGEVARKALAVSGWRPIETAPRNWSAVMLFAPNYNDDWRQVFEGYYDPDRLSWYDQSDLPVSPTHWQPLPAPPVTSESARA